MSKISLITASSNSLSTIKHTIDSVLEQSYPDIEYIIIDNGSIDGTVDIVKSYNDRISEFISEPDNGIYDAMNKGIKLATGDIIGIINSDDFFIDSFAIEKVMDIFNTTQTDCVYADLIYVDKADTNKVIRHWKTNEYIHGAFNKGWHPAHPSFYLRRHVYKQYGDFDLSFKLAADFELMLRMLEKYRISSIYLPIPLVKMRTGGATNKSLVNIFNQNIECIRAFKKNGLNAGILYPLYRLIPKLKQFLS